MFVYFFAQLLIFIHGWHWSYLNTPMGYWYLFELIGLVGIPCITVLSGSPICKPSSH